MCLPVYVCFYCVYTYSPLHIVCLHLHPGNPYNSAFQKYTNTSCLYTCMEDLIIFNIDWFNFKTVKQADAEITTEWSDQMTKEKVSKTASLSGSDNIKNSWLHTQEMCRPPTWTKILTAFFQCSLYCMCIHACILTVCIFWPNCTSWGVFFCNIFASHWLCVYMNLWSMFSFVNVVEAGLNRMQVSCSISLY